MMVVGERSRLSKNKSFIKFFFASTIGNVGDWFDLFALQIIFVYYYHVSAFDIGLLMVAFMCPGLLLSPFAGAIADYFDKKWLLVLTDLLSAILTVSLIYSQNVVISLFFIVGRSAIGAFNAPVQQVAVKCLVADDLLLSASAWMSISFQFCRILGPFLGAIVVSYMAPQACLWINAVSFVISSLIFLMIIFPVDNESQSNTIKKRKLLSLHFMSEQFLVGFRLIYASNVLFTLMIAVILFLIFVMIGENQMVILLKYLFPNSPNILGVVMASNALGSVVAGVILSKIKRINNYYPYICSAILCVGLTSYFYSLFPKNINILLFLPIAFVQGIGLGILLVVYSYGIKSLTATEYMGRIAGASSMLQNAAFLLGALLSGIAVSYLGITATYLLIAIVALIFIFTVTLFKRKLQSIHES